MVYLCQLSVLDHDSGEHGLEVEVAINEQIGHDCVNGMHLDHVGSGVLAVRGAHVQVGTLRVDSEKSTPPARGYTPWPSPSAAPQCRA
eukprot:642118-Rhodomonas_salina.6